MTGINSTYLLRFVDRWGNDSIAETKISTTMKEVVQSIWITDKVIGVYQLVTKEREGEDNYVEIADVTLDAAQQVLTVLAVALKNYPIWGWSHDAATFADRFFPDAVYSLTEEWKMNCDLDNERRKTYSEEMTKRHFEKNKEEYMEKVYYSKYPPLPRGTQVGEEEDGK